MSAIDWSRLALLSLLWGGSFYFVEVALDDVGPFTLVLTRVGLAALVLGLYCRAAGLTAPWSVGLVAGLAFVGIINNAIPFSLLTWGQTQISGSLTSIFNATTPLFTVAVAHFWPGAERATPMKIAGVVAGLAGVAVLIGVGNLTEMGDGIAGPLACLAATSCYAVALVFTRRFRGLHPLVLAASTLTVATIAMAPLAFLFETPYQPMPAAPALAAMAGLAILSSAVAYYLYFSVLASAGPTNASLVTFLVPITAILLLVTFRGETLEPRHLAGLGLILFGLSLVDGRLYSRLLTGAKGKPYNPDPAPPSGSEGVTATAGRFNIRRNRQLKK